MPPAPRGATISYGPRREPGRSAIETSSRPIMRAPSGRSRRSGELRQVPAADLAAALVDRAALHRREARVLDELEHRRLTHLVVRARGSHDVLLDHDRAEVVGAERRRDAADLRALREPRALHVRHVVEVEACDRERAQVVVAARRLDRAVHRRVLLLEGPGDESGEALDTFGERRILRAAHDVEMLQALLVRLPPPPPHWGAPRGGGG